MYLSRLLLPLTDKHVHSLLANPYLLHQGILLAFPCREQGGGGRVLFRVEPEHPNGFARLLVQSEAKPDWDGDGPRKALGFEDACHKPLLLSLGKGQTLRFRLRANPTVKRNGKRLPLVGEGSQRAWLERHFANGGLKLDGVLVIDEGKTLARRPANGQLITVLTVRYEGAVEVQQANGALSTVRSGVGPAKAFGCGLLSVARA